VVVIKLAILAQRAQSFLQSENKALRNFAKSFVILFAFKNL